jgi:Fur family ferric uptake transcriptional regulator
MDSGIRNTNQRVEILEFLRGRKDHPTVDDVYNGVKKKLTRISKATVYKNLKFLAGKGLVQEVNIRGVSRFEPNTMPHHHTICTRCGRIADFSSDKLTGYSMKEASSMKGFDAESASTNFYGTCSRCK